MPHQNAAVEHTFVQFYPALLGPRQKKTIKGGVKLPSLAFLVLAAVLCRCGLRHSNRRFGKKNKNTKCYPEAIR
jgi:hypothetical protein